MKKCVYCNKEVVESKITKDHVVPQGFYREFRKGRNNMGDYYLVVDACETCNNEKSNYDEQFKNLLTIITADKSEYSNALLDITQRSIEQNNNYQQLVSDSNLELVKTLYGDMYRLKDIGFDLYSYIKKYVTKAIYFTQTSELESFEDYNLVVKQVDPLERLKFSRTGDFKNINPRPIDDEIFQYIFSKRDVGYFLFLSFFQHANFFVLLKSIGENLN